MVWKLPVNKVLQENGNRFSSGFRTSSHSFFLCLRFEISFPLSSLYLTGSKLVCFEGTMRKAARGEGGRGYVFLIFSFWGASHPIRGGGWYLTSLLGRGGIYLYCFFVFRTENIQNGTTVAVRSHFRTLSRFIVTATHSNGSLYVRSVEVSVISTGVLDNSLSLKSRQFSTDFREFS